MAARSLPRAAIDAPADTANRRPDQRSKGNTDEKRQKPVCPAALTACGRANAQSVFDFVADANSAERGFATSYVKTVSGITLTVTAADGRHPYLDAGHGGLGVCGTLSSTMQCVPSPDDNIFAGEILILSFDQAVTVNQLWFNNLHDGDRSLSGGKVKIAGGIYDVFQNSPGGAMASFNGAWSPVVAGTTGTAQTFSFAANTNYLIENPNPIGDNYEFYLSGMTVTAVPEPEIYAMMGLGLGLMGWVGRRKRLQAA